MLSKKHKVHETQTNIRIVAKGRHKIRSISLPNKKNVVLHDDQPKPIMLNQIKAEIQKQIQKQKYVNKAPAFWGCILPNHLTKLQQKTLNIEIKKRSKTEQKLASSFYSSLQKYKEGSSQVLLNTYIKRKQKKIQRFKNELNTDNNQLYNEKYRKVYGKGISSIITQYPVPLQRYMDSTQQEERRRKTEETEEKIKKLTEMIKWRNKVIEKIHDQLQAIKNQKYQKMRNL